MNQKLREIGQKLDITDKDIKEIGRAGFTNKILYCVVTPLIAILSFIIGFFVGKGTCPPIDGVTTTTTTTLIPTITTTTSTTTTIGGGYPFAAGLVIPVALAGKKKSSRIAILLVSVIAFLIAIKSYPVFGQAIEYNVYRRN